MTNREIVRELARECDKKNRKNLKNDEKIISFIEEIGGDYLLNEDEIPKSELRNFKMRLTKKVNKLEVGNEAGITTTFLDYFTNNINLMGENVITASSEIKTGYIRRN